ncbi:hypothetical protein BJY04DRAFT_223288 [Aspergillus karnatakaensis]|uniref:fungal specific transcription factor domain-containing protein n=1 Tax=Aspergillus karnatakaensis TaxID=1810916 RepID=UPI003CCD37FC
MSLVKAYYQHFHRAHPILLAEESYAQRQYPNFLTAVVISIGAHFSTHTPAPSSGSSITRQLLAINEVSVWLVQARLLHSIALLGDGSLDEVRSLFVSARDLAIQLRMNRFDALETYASSFGDQELECLRRTWWELVILDGYMMAIWPELGYLTSTLDCDVPVPRDETDCVSSPLDHVPHAHAFCHDFHLNDDEEASLSSWWYRIQASSLLAKVVLLDTLETYNDKGQAMMASLASWRLSLPQDKAQFMDPYGRVNEMLFEAEMLAQVATIMLHFPRSDLSSDFRITTIVSSTAPRRPIRSCTKKVHGIKATEASKEISNLFSIYPSMEKCSPLLIPCLTLCGMVQLATYRSHAQFGNCLELHAERVRLLTGLLRSSGQIWGQAKTAYSEVKAAAADTFPFRKEGGQPSPVQMPSHTYHNASLSNSLALTQQESLLSMPIPSAMPDMSNWPWISDPMSQLLERNNAMQRADEYQLEL